MQSVQATQYRKKPSGFETRIRPVLFSKTRRLEPRTQLHVKRTHAPGLTVDSVQDEETD